MNLTRRSLALLLAGIVTLMPGEPVSAQSLNRDDVWRTTGPGQRQVPIGSLWADADQLTTIFAESNGALYRSLEAGVFWNRIPTPLEMRVRPLLVSGGKLFVAADSGGLFSTPVASEVTWREVLRDVTVTKLIELGDALYAGTTSTGVFSSTDGGDTWTQAGAPLNDKAIDEIVAIGNTLFVMTNSSTGLYRSSDAGASWAAATLPTNGEFLTAVNGMLFMGNAGRDLETRGIWRSLDGGESWALAHSLGASNVFQGLVAAGNKLFAWALRDPWDVFDGRELFLVSSDDGASWAKGGLSFVTNIISLKGIIIAGTAREGVFLSYDKGDTWISANAPLDAATGKGVAAFRIVDRTIYASVLDKVPRDVGPAFWAPGGVYISTDNARNWSVSALGLGQNNEVFDLQVDLRFVLALSTTVRGSSALQLFRSADLGVNWDDVTSSIADAIDVRDAGTAVKLYADGGTLFLTALFGKIALYSTDSGITWQRPQTRSGYLFSLISADGVLYGGTTDTIIRSEDGGANWTALTLNETVFSLLYDNGTLYAGTLGNGLFFSTDGGAVWTQASAPLRTGDVNHLIATQTSIVAGTPSGVFYRVDDGRNWTPAGGALNATSATVFLSVGSRLFAGTRDRGTLFSDDGGASWTPAGSPMNGKNVQAMISVAGRVYAGTTSGVYWTFAGDGRTWYALKTGMGDLAINDLSYLPVSNRLYAATNDGVYLQTLDAVPPAADSILINNQAAFTDSAAVSLLLLAAGADSMIISERQTFDDTGWQAYQTFAPFQLGGGDGAKTIYAKFKDLSSNESSVRDATIVLDTSDPDFSSFPHTPPLPGPPGRAITISQQVAEANLAEYDLYFRRVGEMMDRNTRRISFVNSAAVIEAERVGNKGLDYQIIATDRAGRSTTLANGLLNFFSLPANVGATALGNSRSLPSGAGGAAYRIVSIPLDLPDSPQAKNVFENLGKYGRRGNWRIYSYSGNSQWEEGENIQMQTGTGNFMIRRNGGSLTNAISGATAKTTDGVLGNIPGWQLRGGDWTLIGNPYNTRLELSQLKLKRKGTLLSNHGAEVQVWSYDGQWRNPAADPELALEPWGGLFIRASAADTIVFANDKEPYARNVAKTGIAATELAEGEWSIQITATSGEFSDAVNYFGVRKEAKDDLDNFDWHEPPFLPDGIGLSFPHPEWNDPTELTADFRGLEGEGQRWEISVKGEPSYAVQLSFANIESAPNVLQILLVDESSKIVHDLREETTVVVRIPESGVKSLVIIAGSEFFINKNTAGMLAVPTTFALHQNYPNPFNPSTTIRYQLPVAGRVTVKIFDVMGREVMVLEENKSRAPGYYEVVAQMSALGSGIYFYQIAVAGEQKFQATKKMLFVK